MSRGKRIITNMYKLKPLPTNKFHEKLNEILSGECDYRAADGRVVNFAEQTELQPNNNIAIVRKNS